MKVPVYHISDDEYYFVDTGATTTISAKDGVELIKIMTSCLLGEVGRHEEADPTPVEDFMRDHDMVNDDYDEWGEDEY